MMMTPVGPAAGERPRLPALTAGAPDAALTSLEDGSAR